MPTRLRPFPGEFQRKSRRGAKTLKSPTALLQFAFMFLFASAVRATNVEPVMLKIEQACSATYGPNESKYLRLISLVEQLRINGRELNDIVTELEYPRVNGCSAVEIINEVAAIVAAAGNKKEQLVIDRQRERNMRLAYTGMDRKRAVWNSSALASSLQATLILNFQFDSKTDRLIARKLMAKQNEALTSAEIIAPFLNRTAMGSCMQLFVAPASPPSSRKAWPFTL